MSDVVAGTIEFGVFLVLVVGVFWTGRDRSPNAEDIEMGSGRRASGAHDTTAVERHVAA